MRTGNAMKRRAHGRVRRKPFRALVESLEGRQLLATFQVINAEDNGLGSLRQAILNANSSPGADAIVFDIPATTVLPAAPGNLPFPGFDESTQTWRISLLSPLPTITDQVSIDGYSQAHAPLAFFYPEN